MKVNMNAVLTDITGAEPMKLEAGLDESGKPKTKAATLRAIIQQALGGHVKGDDTMSDDDRYKLYRLGKRLNAEEVNLSAADVVTINNRVSRHYASAYVYGQVKDLLEPPEEDEQAVPQAKPNGSAEAHVN